MGEDQKRMFLAIGLSAAILFGWNYLYPPKTDNINKVKNTQSTKQSIEKAQNNLDSSKPTSAAKPVNSKTYTFTNGYSKIDLNSFLQVTHMSSPESVFDYTEITGENSAIGLEFEIDGQFQSLVFDFNKLNESSFEAVNKEAGVKVNGQFIENGKFLISANSSSPRRFRFLLKSSSKSIDNGGKRNFVILSEDLEHFEVGDNENSEGKISWLGIDFNYHIFAITFDKKIPGFFGSNEQGELRTTFNEPSNTFAYNLIFTKNEYDKLIALGDKLELSVDFGIWSILAVPMLRIMQFFHNYVPNWGLAIILLTLLMRTIMFPLQYKSFQGMKKMQLIQPELVKIREKFKDDPQRLQQESMSLFKRAGANPLGGCLPLIMQMPFFFAFYRVLYSSVELVGAPFIFWIQDLSVKDPYYVLPVLMGLAMFFQQKMTPSPSADPTQQKVLMFMPVVFAFIMSSLPAGLTLYIFVSTIFGVVTQVYIFKKGPETQKPIVV